MSPRRSSSCKECVGHGSVELLPETIVLNIPAGVDAGNKLKVPGKGNINRSGVAGDLIVVLDVAEHPYFKREGLDLICEVPVTYTDLVLGRKAKVPGIDKVVDFDIPAGTRPGTEFRLWGLGVPRVRRPESGDLVAVVRLDMPDYISDDMKDVLDRLSQVDGKQPSKERERYDQIIRS